MEDRIEGPRADLVSMAGKLLRHPCPEDGFMFRMMKNVKTNHAGVKIAVVHIVLHYRTSLSTYDNRKTLSHHEFESQRYKTEDMIHHYPSSGRGVSKKNGDIGTFNCCDLCPLEDP